MTLRGQRICQPLCEAPSDPSATHVRDVDPTGLTLTTPANTAEHSDLQLEVALYVESICSELRLMVKAAELEALSYFLEMARVEASIRLRDAPFRTAVNTTSTRILYNLLNH